MTTARMRPFAAYLFLLLFSCFAGASAAAQAAEGGAGSQTQAENPLKVALLHWYKANQTTSFAVGSQPDGVAFDGANIWTANFGDGTVSKVRANDGAVLGTFKVGFSPIGVTFDGANIWVSDNATNKVSKLRASDGTILGTFSVGSNSSFPFWMTFDGENIWVPYGNNNLAKLRASDGKNLGTFTVGSSPVATAFDGSNIWVGGAPQVDELRPSDGSILAVFNIPGTNVTGVAFDGANVWLSGLTNGRLYKF